MVVVETHSRCPVPSANTPLLPRLAMGSGPSASSPPAAASNDAGPLEEGPERRRVLDDDVAAVDGEFVVCEDLHDLGEAEVIEDRRVVGRDRCVLGGDVVHRRDHEKPCGGDHGECHRPSAAPVAGENGARGSAEAVTERSSVFIGLLQLPAAAPGT